jgi:hypothetical protein
VGNEDKRHSSAGQITIACCPLPIAAAAEQRRMTDSAIAARLINALEAAADREAGQSTQLVSVTIDMITRADAGSVQTSLTRKTKSLVFMGAEFVTESGARIATASSVHKLPT